MRAVPFLVAVLLLIPCAAWPQGTPLGPEFRVNTYTMNDQAQPSIAVDSAGNFVVVWERHYSFFDRGVFGQRYASSGAALGAEFPIQTPPGLSAAPAVGADPAGDFVVIWQFSPLTGTWLVGQRFASSGATLGGQFSIATSGYSYNAAVARDPSGSFVVAWTGNFPGDGSGRGVFARRFSGSGAPLSSQFRVNTYTTSDQSLPSVAADSSGNFVITWSSNAQDGSGLGIFGQRFALSGAPLGSEFRVNTYATNNQGLPSVAADSSGNFVVVWQSAGQDGSGDGVFGQRYASSGASLGPEFRVNTFTTGNQGSPSGSADASGNFVVVWQSDQNGDVYGQRYDSYGATLGSEFRVNTFTPNNQAQAAVAADPLGRFLVVWESEFQDGSGRGVFGQRYSPIFPVELMHFRVE